MSIVGAPAVDKDNSTLPWSANFLLRSLSKESAATAVGPTVGHISNNNDDDDVPMHWIRASLMIDPINNGRVVDGESVRVHVDEDDDDDASSLSLSLSLRRRFIELERDERLLDEQVKVLSMQLESTRKMKVDLVREFNSIQQNKDIGYEEEKKQESGIAVFQQISAAATCDSDYDDCDDILIGQICTICASAPNRLAGTFGSKMATYYRNKTILWSHLVKEHFALEEVAAEEFKGRFDRVSRQRQDEKGLMAEPQLGTLYVTNFRVIFDPINKDKNKDKNISTTLSLNWGTMIYKVKYNPKMKKVAAILSERYKRNGN